jgi:hypothetical protein
MIPKNLDLRHVETGVKLSRAEREFAHRRHRLNRKAAGPHITLMMRLARLRNDRLGINGPRVVLGRRWL